MVWNLITFLPSAPLYGGMKGTRSERLINSAEGVDAIVIANGGEPYLDSVFWYLTEQRSGSFEGAMAIVGKDGELNVLVSILEEESAKSGVGNVHIYHSRAERDEIIKNVLKGCTKIGVDYSKMSLGISEYLKKNIEGLEFSNVAKAIESTTAVKDEKEIQAIREACKISSKVAGQIPELLKIGMTEKEVAATMDSLMREYGGTGNAFDTIAAFGENSSQPHYMPGDCRLKVGDTALFDFGTKYDRYCSDMTRTVFFGKPPAIMERAYDVVLRAQTAGIEAYADGAPAKDADIAARKIIDESEFKGLFIHSFGHGIGMDVHEGISVYSASEQILHSGNIVSAEPGVYIQGVGGIRIEDTCLITDTGCERLTDFDRSLTIVDSE